MCTNRDEYIEMTPTYKRVNCLIWSQIMIVGYYEFAKGTIREKYETSIQDFTVYI